MSRPLAHESVLPRTIGIIGDVHGQDEPLARVLTALERAGADALVCVGDVCGPGDGVAECCRLLASRHVLTVRGNHDRWFLAVASAGGTTRQALDADSIEFLRGLPSTAEIDTQMGLALLCHGLGDNDLARLPRTFGRTYVSRSLRLGHLSLRHRLVVHGHSHECRHARHGEILFVNPGAVRASTSSGCLLLDTAEQRVEQVTY